MSGDSIPVDSGARPQKVERSIVLPYGPASVAQARQRLCEDLHAMEICEDRVDDATLVLSELVSNALRHASPLPSPGNPENSVGVSWRIEVDRGSRSGGWMEIAVRDGGSSTMPRVARPSVSGLGGRGLSIVQTLSGRWGTEMDATTTTVWAVLEISPDDARPAECGADADHGRSAVEQLVDRSAVGVVELRLHLRDDERARSALL